MVDGLIDGSAAEARVGALSMSAHNVIETRDRPSASQPNERRLQCADQGKERGLSSMQPKLKACSLRYLLFKRFISVQEEACLDSAHKYGSQLSCENNV